MMEQSKLLKIIRSSHTSLLLTAPSLSIYCSRMAMTALSQHAQGNQVAQKVLPSCSMQSWPLDRICVSQVSFEKLAHNQTLSLELHTQQQRNLMPNDCLARFCIKLKHPNVLTLKWFCCLALRNLVFSFYAKIPCARCWFHTGTPWPV